MDSILFWNLVALEANRISHTNGMDEQTGPTRSSRALAIVHLAMYDAYAGVINDNVSMPRYIANPPSPGMGASEVAAVSAAAHATLISLFPSQSAMFNLILSGVGNPADPGHAFGLAVAQEILTDRASDPGGASTGYTPSTARGRHRVDPDNPGQGFHGAFYGAQSKGFGITKRFELAPPPFDNNALNADYQDALKEVRGRGIAPELMGTLPQNIKARTVDQSIIGTFWAYDGVAELGTPVRLYNQIIREVAMHALNPQSGMVNTTAENARLFALVNVAMADAAILSWDQKYMHDFWRPVVGIREHDESMGPGATVPDNNISNKCDSGWLPLAAPNTNRIAKNFTPPFPAYPSGHATFGAAAFHITRLFYNQGGKFSDNTLTADNLFDGLSFVSDELNGVSRDNKGAVRPRHLRNFPDGLWQMIEENGRSRVYLGVHWVFDAFVLKENGTPDLTRFGLPDDPMNRKFFGGVPLGLEIAEDIFEFGNGKAPKKSTVLPR